MSADPRRPFLRTRSLALLLPLLTGLVLTSAPAVAAPVVTTPTSNSASAPGVTADEPVVVPADVTVTGSSDATGAVRVVIHVSAAGVSATTGTVALSDGDQLVAAELPVVDGVAIYTGRGLVAGEHRYTAVYRGADGVAGEGNGTVTVRGRATTSLRLDASSPAMGVARIRVEVAVEDGSAVGGTVRVRESGTVVGESDVSDGAALVELTRQSAGTHTYTVAYSGTAEVQDASALVAVDVRGKTPAQLTVTSTSASVGKLVLRAHVTAGDASVTGGTVAVKEGTKTVRAGIKVVGGSAVWRASGLRSGQHTYSVRYSGTATVKAGSTRHVATVKAKVKPALGLTATSTAPKRVTIKMAVTAAGQSRLGGSVKIKEGSRTRKAKLAVKAGKATWSASGIKAGKHTYTVVYSGTSQVKSGSAKVTVKVMKPVVIKEYENCTELNKVHEHGVGRSGAVDQGGSVTDFLRNTKLYNKNTKSDRDKDGIACER